MRLQIFHTVNSGLYITEGSNHLLADGIFDGSAVGFSPMPPALKHQFLERKSFFPYLDHLIFTHTHKDHFDEKTLLEFLSKARPALYSPDPRFRNVGSSLLAPGLELLSMGDFQIYALHTVHDSPQFINFPHCSYLVQLGEERLWISGDASLSPREAELLLRHCPGQVDAAFINLYQAAQPSSHDFFRRLKPRRVFLYHLPFPRDDIFQIHLSMRSALKRYPHDLPPIEILSPMTWVDEKIPAWFTAQV